MYLAKPVPLVRRRDIFEVAERVLADGTIEHAARQRLARSRPGAGRRRRLRVGRRLPAARLRRARAREGASARRSPAPSARIAVSLSSDLSPKFREYERTSTIVANAYIKPIVDRYVSRLTGALEGARAHQRPLHHAVERRPRVAGARLRHADPHRRVRAGGRRPPVRRRSAARKASTACSPSTWAAPRPSSAPSTAASPPSRRPSRSTRCATARAAACPSTSPPSSCWRSAPAAAASPRPTWA